MAGQTRERSVQDEAGQLEQINSVVIGTPCQDDCSSWFAYDLARLAGYSAVSIPNTMLRLLFSQGTYLHMQREDVAVAAVEAGATHILWIDSDMRFPKEALAGLLAREEPIVGANYIKRLPPHIPVAKRGDNAVWTFDNSEGLEAVDYTGFGLMLESTEVYKKIGRPYFPIEYDAERQQYRGEDVLHFNKARLAGFEVKVDHDLSKFVQHTGKMEYTYIHGLDTKEYLERVAQEEQDDKEG